jgi:outer membrane beta-barrel protein
MKRLLAPLVLAGVTLAASPAAAQEIQLRGPLAGARSVARIVQYREGRFALTPTFGITLQDEFSRELLVGLRGEYHFTDWLGVGFWGAFAPAHIDTSLTDQISQRSPGGSFNVPRANQFTNQVGRRNFLFDLHVTFVPLRGKFALFQNLVADTDFYILAGVGFVGIEERADVTLRSSPSYETPYLTGASRQTSQQIQDATFASQTNRASRIAIAPTVGFGINFYLNRFVSIGFEYRIMPFSWNRSGTDENSAATEGVSDTVGNYFQSDVRRRLGVIDSNDRSMSLNQIVNFGVTFFLPTAPRIGR